MKKPALFFSALALFACSETPPAENDTVSSSPPVQSAETTPENTSVNIPAIGPQAVTKTKRAIDWSSAREDLSRSNNGIVTIQSVDEPAAEVPVLLPTGIVISQSADSGPVYRNTPDGYIAFYPGAVYNIVVNGTNEAVDSDVMAANNPDKTPTFSTSTGGAQVWLTRYGADYIVEFECNALESEGELCITETEAMDVVDKLIVARSK